MSSSPEIVRNIELQTVHPGVYYRDTIILSPEPTVLIFLLCLFIFFSAHFYKFESRGTRFRWQNFQVWRSKNHYISCHNLAELWPRTEGFSPKYIPRIPLKSSVDKHMKIAVVGEKFSTISGGGNDSLGCLRWSKDLGFSRAAVLKI